MTAADDDNASAATSATATAHMLTLLTLASITLPNSTRKHQTCFCVCKMRPSLQVRSDLERVAKDLCIQQVLSFHPAELRRDGFQGGGSDVATEVLARSTTTMKTPTTTTCSTASSSCVPAPPAAFEQHKCEPASVRAQVNRVHEVFLQRRKDGKLTTFATKLLALVQMVEQELGIGEDQLHQSPWQEAGRLEEWGAWAHKQSVRKGAGNPEAYVVVWWW
jgi:hypothetical protein